MSTDVEAVRADALFRRWREERDAGALGELFDHVAPELFRLALILSPDAGSAEDALQETFLAALENGDAHDPDRPVVPWLVGILRNKVLLARRRAARVPDPTRLEPRLPVSDPADDAGARETRDRVRRAIHDLPEPYRGAALLRWVHGLEPAEIAEVRGEPPGTVWSLLSRARDRLRQSLGVLPFLVFGTRRPRGLDAVRHAVLLRGAILAAASAAAPATTGAGIVGGVYMAKKTVIIAATVTVVAAASWLALQALQPPPPSRHSAAGEAPTLATARTKDRSVSVPAAPPAPLVGDGAIVGRLGRGAPFRPLAGGVRISDTAGATTEGECGTDGRFRVEDLPRLHPLVVYASAPGLLTAVLRDVRVPATGTLDLGDVLLGGPCALEVHTVDRLGQPVAGATIEAHRYFRPGAADPFAEPSVPRAEAVATADATGQVMFPQLSPGTWTVTAAAPGRARAAATVTLVEGTTRDPVRFVLLAGHALAGHVLSAQGDPLPGVVVSAHGERGGNGSPPFDRAHATTDAAGCYQLDGLAPGTWKLFVRPRADAVLSAGAVRVPAVEEYDIRLRGGVVIQGRVVDADTNAGLAGADVQAQVFMQGEPDRAKFRTQSGADGAFRIEGVPPGILFEGSLRVKLEGYVDFPSMRSQPGAERAEMRAGDVVERVLALERGSRVYGTVRGPDGRPVAGARVYLSGRTSSRPEPLTDDTGAYAFEGVQPGTALVTVYAPGLCQPDLPARWWQAQREGTLPAEWTVEVPERGEVVKDLVLALAGALEGTVVDGNGDGVPGATVRVSHGSILVQAAASVTDAEGAFRVENLSPGVDFAVGAQGPEGALGRTEGVSVPEGEITTGVRIALEPGASVSGVVRRNDGADLVDTSLRLAPGVADPKRTWEIDRVLLTAIPVPVAADGTFAVEGLKPGRYTVVADAVGSARVFQPRIDLEAGEKLEGVEVELPAERTISGRVVGPGGSPVAGALISVKAISEERMWTAGEYFDATGVTDADGRFEQRGLTESLHAVTARAPGLVERSIEARSGDRDVRVELAEALTISGVVVDRATGEPVAGAFVSANPYDPPPRFMHNAGTKTGSDGAFTLDGLLPGVYRLWVNPREGSGHGFIPRRVDRIAAGSRGVRIKVDSGLSIAGRVLDLEGKPVVGVSLSATGQKPDGSLDTSRRAGASTEDGGAFRLRGLKPGLYVITVNPLYSGGGVSGIGAVQATKEHVEAGAEDLEIRLPLGEPIRGRVVGIPDGSRGGILRVIPAKDGRAPAVPWQSGTFVSVGADGTFTTPSLESGKTWDIVAEQFEGMAGGVVTGVASGTSGIEIRLVEGQSLTGRVVDEIGEPVGPGVPVRAVAESQPSNAPGREARGATRKDGTFTLEGLGPYRFRLTAGGNRSEVLPSRTPVEARAGRQDVVVRVVRGATLAGRLTDSGGRPLARVGISVVEGPDGAKGRWTRTGDDGTFAIHGLPIGTVRLQVKLAGRARDLGEFSAPASDLRVILPDGE